MKDGRVCSLQTLSGTGALRIGFDFIKQELPSTVHVSDPTWANHHNIINRAGLEFKKYPYYDPVTKKVRINDYLEHLRKADEGLPFNDLSIEIRQNQALQKVVPRKTKAPNQ